MMIAITFQLYSQIKVFSGGKTAIGSLNAHSTYKHKIDGTFVLTDGSSDDFKFYNHRFYIGGATGNELFNIYSNGNTAFKTTVDHSADWAYAQQSVVNRANTKALVVTYNGGDKFRAMGDGVLWSYQGYVFSDSTLKENIRPLSNILSKLTQLNGYNYNLKKEILNPNAAPNTFIDSTQNPTEIGLLAQQVERIFPEAVRTDEKGIKGVSYVSLIPVLIEAIKEQQAKITLLEDKISKCCTIKN